MLCGYLQQRCLDCCLVADVGAVGGDPLMALIDILANCKSQLWEWHGKRISHMSLVVAGQSLNIIGNPHGVANGWFFWPANFDPIWLQNCDGYEEQK